MISLLITLIVPTFAHAKCTFTAETKAVNIEWTAFKTTDKAPVVGTFKIVEVKGLENAKDLKKMVQSWKATIDVSSLETQNPARNVTLLDSFFKKLKQPEITGKIKKFKGSEQGTFDLALTFGGVTHSVPMEFIFEIEKETRKHKLVAMGEMHLSDFKAGAALTSLNTACIDLHKGADGKSKTWEDVKLKISIPLEKNCE
ncbi:MAG: YceI family protein [Xanthomonadaceae bacterium]|nr:YceI family protein [Xanthomonadaceae bacterium]